MLQDLKIWSIVYLFQEETKSKLELTTSTKTSDIIDKLLLRRHCWDNKITKLMKLNLPNTMMLLIQLTKHYNYWTHFPILLWFNSRNSNHTCRKCRRRRSGIRSSLALCSQPYFHLLHLRTSLTKDYLERSSIHYRNSEVKLLMLSTDWLLMRTNQLSILRKELNNWMLN